MAEPIGLALGFAGLVGVFTSCVDCFKLVQVYRRRHSDYDIYQTMLDNQQFLFMAWGQACGFMDEESDLKHHFDDPLSKSLNGQIKQTISSVKFLLTNTDQLKTKYGLKIEKRVRTNEDSERHTRIPSAFERVFQTTTKFWNTSLQRKERIIGAIQWTINDKDKFDDLIDHIRNLVDDLDRLTKDLGVPWSRHWIVKYEMEKIDDQDSLEAITEVNLSGVDNDIVSVAASRQLARIREQSVFATGQLKPDDSVSVFKQARALLPIDEFEEDIEVGPQPIEVTRVPLNQWRNIKTRQGIFPWLGVLIVATGVDGETKPDVNQDAWGFIRRGSILARDSVPESPTTISRLAINSRILLTALGKITGREIPESNNVMVHPFKYLVVYEEEIRAAHAKAEDQRAVLAAADPPSDAADVTDSASQSQPTQVDETESNLVNAPSATGGRLGNLTRVKDELACLVEFMDSDLSNILNLKRNATTKAISDVRFEDLWLLYTPGETVYSEGTEKDSTHEQAYRVLHATGGRHILDEDHDASTANIPGPAPSFGDVRDDEEYVGHAAYSAMTPLIVDCYYLESDGWNVGPRPKRFIISPYPDTRRITSLPIFPINLCSLEQRETLYNRGKLYIKICRVMQMQYSGLSLRELEDGHRESCRHCSQNDLLEEITGHVIIDTAAAIKHFRGVSCNWDVEFGAGVLSRPTKANARECFEVITRDSGRRSTDIFDDSFIDLQRRIQLKKLIARRWALGLLQEFPPDECLHLPDRMYGFVLGTRKWYPLSLKYLSSFKWQPKLIDSLVLPNSQKQLVFAMLHGSQEWRADAPAGDIVRSHGRSRIVLLHGPPGTGKTLLAEAISQSLRRPLFVINCGEIGSLARGADAKLEAWFSLASRWGCVLLVEEADIFLTRRSMGDELEMVELTSVLLRLLRSFSGPIFLTTNRVGMFDEGFLSHISFSLYFPPLNLAATLSIWKNVLKYVANDFRLKLEVDYDAILNMARELFDSGRRMDGRVIRNRCLTAISLATFDNDRRERPKLERKHFEVVEEAANCFDAYLEHVTGELPRARGPHAG